MGIEDIKQPFASFIKDETSSKVSNNDKMIEEFLSKNDKKIANIIEGFDRETSKIAKNIKYMEVYSSFIENKVAKNDIKNDQQNNEPQKKSSDNNNNSQSQKESSDNNNGNQTVLNNDYQN